MLRPLAAVLAVLALAACGHRGAAAPQSSQPSRDGATLGAYVLDATPASPARPSSGAAQPAPGACSQGHDAYRVLVFLVSADTGTSVTRIVADLRTGRSLADVAGGRTDQVEQQAIGLVQAWLQFAQANDKLTADEAAFYRSVAQGVIAGLMKANVSSCIPAVG
jgi:hypothetical protein